MRVCRPFTVAATVAALVVATYGALPTNADPPISECDIVGTEQSDIICGFELSNKWEGYSCSMEGVIHGNPEVPDMICGVGGDDIIIAGRDDVV